MSVPSISVRAILLSLFSAAALCTGSIARADGYAYGHVWADLSDLRLIHANGTPFAADDLTSVTHAYSAASHLSSGLGRVLEQNAGPGSMPVDLARSCLRPTCPHWVENEVDGWGFVPLVFAYSDQQSTAPLLDEFSGYRLRQRSEAASLDGIGGAWGAWESRTSSQLSIDFRPTEDGTMTVAFLGTSQLFGQLAPGVSNTMLGHVAATIEVIGVESGERWALMPAALNRMVGRGMTMFPIGGKKVTA